MFYKHLLFWKVCPIWPLSYTGTVYYWNSLSAELFSHCWAKLLFRTWWKLSFVGVLLCLKLKVCPNLIYYRNSFSVQLLQKSGQNFMSFVALFRTYSLAQLLGNPETQFMKLLSKCWRMCIWCNFLSRSYAPFEVSVLVSKTLIKLLNRLFLRTHTLNVKISRKYWFLFFSLQLCPILFIVFIRQAFFIALSITGKQC